MPSLPTDNMPRPTASLPYFAKQLRRAQPDQFPVRRRNAPEFYQRHPGLFQRGNVMFRSDCRSQQIIQVRRMSKYQNNGQILVLGELPEKLKGFRTRQKQVGASDFLF